MSLSRLERIQRLDAALPQTQCTQCGFDGCLPYAEAMADGAAGTDRCPPGGDAGAQALADLLGQPFQPFDRTRGADAPLTVARIDEAHCIGCMLCIRACPVDAIIGGNKRMHAVLTDACTGCGLCVPPCPVDCITMEPVLPARAWTADDATRARMHHQRRQRRLARVPVEARAAAGPVAAPRAAAASADAAPADAADRKRDAIAAALARARARRQP